MIVRKLRTGEYQRLFQIDEQAGQETGFLHGIGALSHDDAVDLRAIEQFAQAPN